MTPANVGNYTKIQMIITAAHPDQFFSEASRLPEGPQRLRKSAKSDKQNRAVTVGTKGHAGLGSQKSRT